MFVLSLLYCATQDLTHLQGYIKDPNPDIRATVVSAVRYTFADTSSSYDQLLSPLLPDFFSLMVDEHLVNICYSDIQVADHIADRPTTRPLCTQLCFSC